MKKIYLILASALLCAAAAQAQDAPAIVSGVTFSVAGEKQAVDEDGNPIENSFVLPSVDADVKIELKNYNKDVAGAGDWTPFVVWTKGTGYAIDQDFEEPTPLGNDTYSFTLNKEKWGNPSAGNFYVTVMLCFVNADMDFYVDADDEPLMFDVSYITPNEFPAEFLYAYPDDAWEDGDSFAKAYKANGEGCRFNFNNIVEFDDKEFMGEILYTRNDGISVMPVDISMLGENEIQPGQTVPTGKATVGFSPLDGNYVVAVQYWNPDIPADKIASIEITLWDMTSKGVTIDEETAKIYNNGTTPNVQQMPKSRLAEGLGVANESVDVYNMQGMLVKANVNKSTIQDLPAGLYIVDGKKVIVR